VACPPTVAGYRVSPAQPIPALLATRSSGRVVEHPLKYLQIIRPVNTANLLRLCLLAWQRGDPLTFLYKTESRLGAFFLAAHDGKFHLYLNGDRLGEYDDARRAAEDLAAGKVALPGGADASTLEIPGRSTSPRSEQPLRSATTNRTSRGGGKGEQRPVRRVTFVNEIVVGYEWTFIHERGGA
jgi:hypothetical protein